MIITDIAGNTEYLTGLKSIKRFRSVSGEKTLAFLIFPTEQNSHSFNLVQEESVVEFKGEEYRIKQMQEKNKGQTFYKEVVATHTFFDLIDEYQYNTHTGSLTFQASLQFVFTGTPYTWDIVDTFYAQDFENFGNDNRLALFQEVLKRYGAEFTLNGTHLTFKKEIGNDTDFQFRYSYNIKTINRSVNTNNLSTYIKGYGKKNEDGSYLIQSEYTSPNASIFGIRHAKPVEDERYTTVEGLNERLIAELQDTPEVSITLDFVDLRRAGFPYDVPNEGDDVFLIYEPMGLDLETRIMDITEEFSEFSDYPIKTDVTLANFRNNMTDKFVEFSRTSKTVDGIMSGNKQLPYNALDDAVKRATAALQRAETELEFENGIIARDKNNPNFLVLFNSNGIGISRDGGATFKEAITSDGFVLSAGAIGQLAANNIQIGADTAFSNGYDPTKIEVGGRNLAQGTASAKTATGTGGTNQVTNLYDVDFGKVYGKQVTLSFDIVATTNSGEAKIQWNNAPWGIGHVTNVSTTKQRVIHTFTQANTGTPSGLAVRLDNVTGTVTISNLKLEIGNKATDYTQSPEDVASDSQAKADAAKQSVKTDLRMTAPLPTSLTLNQDGITASTSTTDKYARLDYRGLFINKGAIQIQRPDGYNVIVDGVLKNNFAVQAAEPPYQTTGVTKVGSFYKVVTNNRFESVQRYTFKHDSRYLRIIVAMSSDPAQTAYMSFDLTNITDGNTIIQTATLTEGNSGEIENGFQGYRKEILMDLGVPTGEIRVLYWRQYSSSSTSAAYGRVAYIMQEG